MTTDNIITVSNTSYNDIYNYHSVLNDYVTKSDIDKMKISPIIGDNNTITFNINNKPIIIIDQNSIKYIKNGEEIIVENEEDLIYSLRYFLNRDLGDMSKFYKSEKERLLEEICKDLDISDERYLKMKKCLK